MMHEEYGYLSITQVRRLNQEAGRHFLDASTMRFFDSRTARRAYLTRDGALAFFVTSERFMPFDGPASPRTYSVRVLQLTTGETPRTLRGDIETVGAFEQYATRRQADRAARAMAVDPSDYLDSIAQDSTREAAQA